MSRARSWMFRERADTARERSAMPILFCTAVVTLYGLTVPEPPSKIGARKGRAMVRHNLNLMLEAQ